MLEMTIAVDETQVIEMVRQMSPKSKKIVLDLLLPELDPYEHLAEQGQKQLRQLAADRGISWDSLSEDEQIRLIDDILHEN